jgi:hypothetical protein
LALNAGQSLEPRQAVVFEMERSGGAELEDMLCQRRMQLMEFLLVLELEVLELLLMLVC